MTATVIPFSLRGVNDNSDWVPPAPTSFLQRRMIEDAIERLIALLDTVDGDADIEEDDHSGDPLEVNGEHPTEDGRDLLPTRPIYGVDQSHGPINIEVATDAYLAELRRA